MLGESYWSRALRARIDRRRLAAIGASGLAAVGLAACGRSGGGAPAATPGAQTGQASGGTPQTGGTLNVAINYNPMLDPHKQSSVQLQGAGGVMQRLFRFKTGLDPQTGLNWDIEPALALSAESPDAITWTIKLRPNVKFQNFAPVNGHAFESDDVKTSFQRILDPATGSPNRGALDMMSAAQIQTPDKQTVIFKLNYPYSPFRNLLANPAYATIYPREAYAGGYDPLKQAIGTGPFTLDSVQPDVAYIYKKNPDYWEKGVPNVDQVKLAIIVDSAQQLAQFTGKNLDEILITDLNTANAAKQSNPQAAFSRTSNVGPNPLYFQMGDPTGPFLDIRLRRAVGMAVDREALGKAVYGEYESVVFVPGYVGKWSMTASELPADIQQYYKYNPAETKKLLEAAGATNQQFKFVRLTGGPFNSASQQKIAETVNSMVSASGFKTTLISHDYFKDFVANGKGSRQGYFDKDMMCFFAASSYNDPDDWLFSYFHSKSTSNQEHLSDSTYDAMVDKERALVNDDDRLKAVKEIQKYLADKMYAPSTVGTYNWVLVHPRVQNYQYTRSSDKMEESYAKTWIKAS
ncbi:MAG TPA: ABC transporter substrate-binding protein [Dehalococcoidia bacterium]|nr:ABC transporter substrate-binding protein [Dehalococcoidia bacterium]